jgi:hypothetical protein
LHGSPAFWAGKQRRFQSIERGPSLWHRQLIGGSSATSLIPGVRALASGRKINRRPYLRNIAGHYLIALLRISPAFSKHCSSCTYVAWLCSPAFCHVASKERTSLVDENLLLAGAQVHSTARFNT